MGVGAVCGATKRVDGQVGTHAPKPLSPPAAAPTTLMGKERPLLRTGMLSMLLTSPELRAQVRAQRVSGGGGAGARARRRGAAVARACPVQADTHALLPSPKPPTYPLPP